MKITIDKAAGFCPGVRRAIRTAEAELEQAKYLSTLGSLLHNESEMQRLAKYGLELVTKDEIKDLSGKKVLFRTHGEPPETFNLANKNGVEIIDATCGVVRRLQQQVNKAAKEMEELNGQVLIYGKVGHPEVNGLLGYCEGRGVLISSLDDLVKVDLTRPIRLFSQTTMDGEAYLATAKEIQQRANQLSPVSDFEKYDTICRHVSNRIPSIKKFASEVELLIFVSGKASSNGKKLFSVCSKVNPESYFISGPDELRPEWFANKQTIGISGAASTPEWLMEEVAKKIGEIN